MLGQATLENSWEPIWNLLAQSLEVMARGKKVRRGIIWSIVGDLGFLPSEFQFPTAMSNYPAGPPTCLATMMHPRT